MCLDHRKLQPLDTCSDLLSVEWSYEAGSHVKLCEAGILPYLHGK